jgi:hypothetical protein
MTGLGSFWAVVDGHPHAHCEGSLAPGDVAMADAVSAVR